LKENGNGKSWFKKHYRQTKNNKPVKINEELNFVVVRMEKDTRERKQNKNKEKKRKTNPGQNCSV
jgi:hypothetical protein